MTMGKFGKMALDRYDECLRQGLTAKEATRNMIAFIAGGMVFEPALSSLMINAVMGGVTDVRALAQTWEEPTTDTRDMISPES